MPWRTRTEFTNHDPRKQFILIVPPAKHHIVRFLARMADQKPDSWPVARHCRMLKFSKRQRHPRSKINFGKRRTIERNVILLQSPVIVFNDSAPQHRSINETLLTLKV